MRTLAWKPSRFLQGRVTYRPGPEDDIPDTQPDELELLIAQHCACYPDEERRAWMTRELRRWAGEEG
jgi:hypothetical protein